MNKEQPTKEVQQVSSTNKAFRNTNANEHINNGQAYQVFPDGILVSKTKLVRNIKREHRAKALYSIGLNTLALNPHLSENEIFSSLCSINNNPKQINVPLKYHELIKIVANIFKKRDEEGELTPDLNHTRKVIFDTANYPMTKQEIRMIVGRVTGELKAAKTKQAIYDAIENWNKPEKITIKKLSILLGAGFSERTIKNYWMEFKDYVKAVNANIKEHKMSEGKISIEAVGQSPDFAPIEAKPSEPLYDSIDSFLQLVRTHSESILSETIKRYYNEMAELGIERNEANIKSVLML